MLLCVFPNEIFVKNLYHKTYNWNSETVETVHSKLLILVRDRYIYILLSKGLKLHVLAPKDIQPPDFGAKLFHLNFSVKRS